MVSGSRPACGCMLRKLWIMAGNVYTIAARWLQIACRMRPAAPSFDYRMSGKLHRGRDGGKDRMMWQDDARKEAKPCQVRRSRQPIPRRYYDFNRIRPRLYAGAAALYIMRPISFRTDLESRFRHLSIICDSLRSRSCRCGCRC